MPTPVYQMHQDHYRTIIEADMEYFGAQHLPYAILAIAVMFFFSILPVLLLVIYPFQCFQKLLNLFPLRWYILHTFMDTFQGCYKDGTEAGTHDYLWFASTFLILRIIHLLLSALLDALDACVELPKQIHQL